MKYKVGDRFVVTKNNTCGYQVGATITIEEADSDENEHLPYLIEDWYLGDNTTIKDCDECCEQGWNIDAFAQYIIDEVDMGKKINIDDLDCGNMVVKGNCYEDVISILLSNGYDVAVSKDDQDDFYFAKFEISYNKKSVDNF